MIISICLGTEYQRRSSSNNRKVLLYAFNLCTYAVFYLWHMSGPSRNQTLPSGSIVEGEMDK